MKSLRTAILVVALGAGLSGLLASDAATIGVAPGSASAPRAVWTEIKWPFPLDQWGLGRAFRCEAADCGTEISLYLRAKIGFCNCATGVSDDAELDRIGDLEILSEQWVGLEDGQEIKVGHLNGRSRPFNVTMRFAPPVTAIAIGFNDKCDVAVATVVADRERIKDAHRYAVAFLNSQLVLHWAELELGL